MKTMSKGLVLILGMMSVASANAGTMLCKQVDHSPYTIHMAALRVESGPQFFATYVQVSNSIAVTSIARQLGVSALATVLEITSPNQSACGIEEVTSPYAEGIIRAKLNCRLNARVDTIRFLDFAGNLVQEVQADGDIVIGHTPLNPDDVEKLRIRLKTASGQAEAGEVFVGPECRYLNY